jgi:hypothetical protein
MKTKIEALIKLARDQAFEASVHVANAASDAEGNIDPTQVAKLVRAEQLLDEARAILFSLHGNIRGGK